MKLSFKTSDAPATLTNLAVNIPAVQDSAAAIV